MKPVASVSRLDERHHCGAYPQAALVHGLGLSGFNSIGTNHEKKKLADLGGICTQPGRII